VQEELPELPKPPATKEVVLALAIVRDGERVLLARAPEGGFLAGTWAPPFAEAPVGVDPPDLLASAAAGTHGLELVVGKLLGTVRHTITRHRIEARCYAATVSGGSADGEARFVEEADLPRYGLSALAARSLAFQLM
jgi:adenine-specific DNA glycosylase